jgi:NADPH:quinone reductase
LLREFGAEPVTYGPGLEERIRVLAPGGADAAFDAVGGDEALDTSLAVVPDRDRIVTAVASPRAFDEGIKVIGGAPGADAGTGIRDEARLQLVRLAEGGKLRVVVAATYPLAEAAAAHRALATGHTHGKIILIP